MNIKSVNPLQSRAIMLLMIANVLVFGYLLTSKTASPLTEFTPLIINHLSFGDGEIDVSTYNFKAANFVIHFACFGVIMLVLRSFYDRAFHGSFKAARKAKQDEFDKINERVELGKVQSASVENGGFLGTTTSTIETEKGIYRVLGDIGSIEKGVQVSRRQNELYFGLTEGKSYTLKL
ncbi:hypothetical protein VIBNISOn1_530015 [Vibrio nigripulchritudo SOn1]|uniref:Uncharacterized protein n=1 Tax=Vibrio nigripulchritudo SOn1 TaxID=1238450 RepID=A0AAV2VUT1_9VIBR|nr:hypothetical protein [Vibrio nigripulchritudo]CCO48446.1 hypothetical protein VIBNISOn1_530015 [Vibrio nigripulchritudo SOn1]